MKRNFDNQSVPAVDAAKYINLSIPSEDPEYVRGIFDMLDLSVSSIDSHANYELAKQLLKVNMKFRFRPEYDLEVYSKAQQPFRLKLWKDEVCRVVNNGVIRTAWKTANEEERTRILERLGINLSTDHCSGTSTVVPVFDHISNEVIRNINSAKKSIHIAMSWFTNFEIYKALIAALEREVEVILVTNNDLINNGGYCLNFNELINLGMELHLAEYPEMMHHKFCIIDDELVMNGSYNWTFLAEDNNLENILVIKGEKAVIDRFKVEFSQLIQHFPNYEKMPDCVPERPEYDRSAFRQYISEELVARSNRHIGNVKENIRQARLLSPTSRTVVKAVARYRVDEDNSNRTIEQMDHEVSTYNVQQRQERQAKLTTHQQEVELQIETLASQAEAISQERDAVAAQTEQRIQSASSDSERELARIEGETQQQRLFEELNKIESERANAESEHTSLVQQIEQTRSEIDVIQQTTSVETKGGRGTLKINLKWMTTDDLDLHVFDPDGIEIFYNQKSHICQGSEGKLDIDANAGGPKTNTPQENIYWEDKAPLGRYKVVVNWYAKHSQSTSVPFTVTVYPANGEVRKETHTLSHVKEDIKVFEFEYTEEGVIYL